MTERPCVCDSRAPCLLHWYENVKDRDDAVEKRHADNFPDRRPKRRAYSPKKRPQL